MFNKFLIASLLLVGIFCASVPCTQYQASSFGNATDCSIARVDGLTISWGARINFKTTYDWKQASVGNVLADMTSPRLPIGPSKSQCSTKAAKYTAGQSVLVNCTQSFSAVPVGYANVVTAFDGSDYPLGFSMKVPLSFVPENLQTQ